MKVLFIFNVSTVVKLYEDIACNLFSQHYILQKQEEGHRSIFKGVFVDAEPGKCYKYSTLQHVFCNNNGFAVLLPFKGSGHC